MVDQSFTTPLETAVRHNQLSRRRFLHGVGAAALLPAGLSTLAACGGGSSEAGTAASGSVSFVFYGDADTQKAYEKLFTKFRATYPDITLKAQGVPAKSWADFANVVSTRLAGGQPVDVVQIATEGQRLFMSKDLLEPLDSYIAKDQAMIDAYYKDTPPQIQGWLKQYAAKDGHTFFMPGGYNTMAVYASGKIFQKAGLDAPTEDWTWDEFRSAGLQIKSKTGAYLTSVNASYFGSVMPWLLTNGTSAISEDWTKSQLDSPAAVEALTFARSLVVDGLSPKPGGEFDAPTAMAQGKLATFGGARGETNQLRRLNALDGVAITRWPQKVAQGTPVGWDAWPILKGSKNKAAAWTLITYLISEEFGDAITTGGGGAVPARLSDATGADFLKDAPKNSELLSKQLDSATPIPGPNRGAECQMAIEEAWLQGISGTKDPQTALSEANSKLQGLLAS